VAPAAAVVAAAPAPVEQAPGAQVMAELAPGWVEDPARASAGAQRIDSPCRSVRRRLLRRRAPIRCWPRSSAQPFHSRRPSTRTWLPSTTHCSSRSSRIPWASSRKPTTCPRLNQSCPVGGRARTCTAPPPDWLTASAIRRRSIRIERPE